MNVEFVQPQVTLLRGPSYSEALRAIEESARVSHRSEARNPAKCVRWKGHPNSHTVDERDRATPSCDEVFWSQPTAERFVETWAIKHGDASILEHVLLTVRWVADRGVLGEITRHRHLSPTVESTRFVNYNRRGAVQFVIPPWIDRALAEKNVTGERVPILAPSTRPFVAFGRSERWGVGCWLDAQLYELDLADGTPEEARTLLPFALATHMDFSGNVRCWRELLQKRAQNTVGKPHPQMLQVAIPTLRALKQKYGVLFADIPEIEWRAEWPLAEVAT